MAECTLKITSHSKARIFFSFVCLFLMASIFIPLFGESGIYLSLYLWSSLLFICLILCEFFPPKNTLSTFGRFRKLLCKTDDAYGMQGCVVWVTNSESSFDTCKCLASTCRCTAHCLVTYTRRIFVLYFGKKLVPYLLEDIGPLNTSLWTQWKIECFIEDDLSVFARNGK